MKLKRAYLALAVLLAIWMLNVWVCSSITKRAYELKSMEREKSYIKNQVDKLQVEITAFKSPGRISKLAVDELGLVKVSGDGAVQVKMKSR